MLAHAEGEIRAAVAAALRAWLGSRRGVWFLLDPRYLIGVAAAPWLQATTLECDGYGPFGGQKRQRGWKEGKSKRDFRNQTVWLRGIVGDV